MIELRSPDLLVELEPNHGAEIAELTDRRTGRRLLGHPPFTPAHPRGGDLDEDAWTLGYRGGWQVLAPNAGNACVVDGVSHGFHGRASVDPWKVVVHEHDRAVLRWSGHGLELTRGVAVAADTVTVELTWTASGAPAPLIAVEHIVFGATLLDPAWEISAEAVVHELSEADGPVEPPATAARWSGSRSLQPPRATLAALTGLSVGRAVIANPDAGVRIELQWDVAKLGAVWLWEELRASGGVWERRTELAGVEPASVPHTLGLARAIEAGQAWWARPGERDGYRLTLRACACAAGGIDTPSRRPYVEHVGASGDPGLRR